MASFKKINLIIVLGMHRSGSTAIARALEVFNVDVGSNLIPANPDIYSSGFWEDMDVVKLNQDILGFIYTEWSDLSIISDLRLAALIRNKHFLARACKLIKDKLTNNKVMEIKDSRMTILMPFWKKVFDSMNIVIGYVIVFRNPDGVSDSILHRDKISKEQSDMLWLIDNDTALKFTKNSPKLFLDYDLFLDEPVNHLERIEDAFELKINKKLLSDYLFNFLNNNLRHSHNAINTKKIPSSFSSLTENFYNFLIELSASVRPVIKVPSGILNSISQVKFITEAVLTERETHVVNLEIIARERRNNITNLKLNSSINRLPSNFNEEEYLDLNPDVRQAQVLPTEHYLNHGIQEGRIYSRNRLPSNFNEEEYLDLNPDVRQAQVLPTEHYLNHGIQEGRIYSLSEKYKQYQLLDKDKNKKTILLISHEATRTGAPILSLSLVKEFSVHYNVVVFLLQGGELVDYFLSSSAVTIVVGEVRGQPILAGCILDRLLESNKFEYSVVNSLESSLDVLPFLAKNLIHTLNLIHEYATLYAHSADVMKFLSDYPGDIVFSCQSTCDDACTIYPDILKKIIYILPQGKSDVPKKEGNIESQNEANIIRNLMRPKGCEDSIVVLGAGTIYLRKGVDLFIQTASKVIMMNPEKKYHFVWIGKQIDKDIDLSYCIFIKDQIKRLGLGEVVTIIDETSEFAEAFEHADLFLISSRLDPLPNTAIDAMAQSIPVLCFEYATGVAEYLHIGGLRNHCIANYLDCEDMATKIIALSDSADLRIRVGKACAEIFKNNFQIDQYVKKLDIIAQESILRTARDIDEIGYSGFFNESFYNIPGEDNLKINKLIEKYVQEWQFGQICRKPIPGFHPGIYRECNKLTPKDGDPFAHYLRNSRPYGKWITPLLIYSNKVDDSNIIKKIKSILHIHVHYPDLLNEILERIKLNINHPDLFLSFSKGVKKSEIKQALKNYQGVVIDILETPNKGRDIGPFLTEFLGGITKDYQYIGHVHTKKSTNTKKEVAQNWYIFNLENIIGGTSGGMIDRILVAMHEDSSLGLVFPDDPYCIGWGKNLPFAMNLAAKLGIEALENQFNFPVGTMFWARSTAINDFVKLKLNWDDYPAEPIPSDGTLLHAIERMIPFVAENQGYKYIATNIAGISR